jgi:hypothetical protein
MGSRKLSAKISAAVVNAGLTISVNLQGFAAGGRPARRRNRCWKAGFPAHWRTGRPLLRPEIFFTLSRPAVNTLATGLD